MFPATELTKNASAEFKTFVTIIGIIWIGATITHSVAAYKLSKVNKKLSEIQIKKLEAEGYTV